MTTVTFIFPDGTEKSLQVRPGTNVMDAAVSNDIEGIEANCRGNCACSTCHVYVDNEWLELVGPASGIEEDILDFWEVFLSGMCQHCEESKLLI